jgi:hypothetical protein
MIFAPFSGLIFKKTTSYAFIFIILFYCIDYLHLYVDFRPRRPKDKLPTGKEFFFDVGVSISLGVAFYLTVLQGLINIALIFLSLASIMILFYPEPSNRWRSFYNMSRCILVLLCTVGCISSFIIGSNITPFLACLLFAIPTLWYALVVVFYCAVDVKS